MTGRSSPKKLRCAVYTRKSTEEGLDQDFNSLDAQFEACSAYIASQGSLGWSLVDKRYDDGGISGATMGRPALQRLLNDISKEQVDVIVVYKIDRLTRSLADFARIVEILDDKDASFVSVTLQFNTTTSMGRLTLNVLLSFAQFEREVTAERIRDKIAASKKKGMWMGGVVPLGYRVEDRKLLVNDEEAGTVRYLFNRYMELKSVRFLMEDARSRGLKRRYVKQRDGTIKKTRPFGRGNLYHLLSNPIYIGKIRHREQVYDGQHEAIITADLFDRVQVLLPVGSPKRRSPSNSPGTHLLAGLLYDEHGNRLRATHANKKGIRYQYYVSGHLIDQRKNGTDGWRLPAEQVDSIVEDNVIQLLCNKAILSELLQQIEPPADVHSTLERAQSIAIEWRSLSALKRKETLGKIISRVDIQPGLLCIHIDRARLIALLQDEENNKQKTSSNSSIDATFKIECPFTLRRKGVETKLVLTDGSPTQPEPDQAFIDLINRAHACLVLMTDGANRTLADIAKILDVNASEVSRTLPLAFLSPQITRQILEGKQPPELTARRL